jgi:hypothetical protein
MTRLAPVVFLLDVDGTAAWLAPHRTFEGRRRSNTILLKRLTPAALDEAAVVEIARRYREWVDTDEDRIIARHLRKLMEKSS